MDLHVSLEGIDRIRTLITDLERRAGDLTPAMKSIGEHIVSVARMSFRAEQSPAGVPWPKSKRAIKDSGKTLADTGRLKASISHQANRDAVKVSTGTNVQYAAVHQFGFLGTVNVPAHSRKVTQAFGRALEPPVTANVRAHSRRMIITARPYMPVTMAEIGESDVEAILIRHLSRAGV